MPILRFLTSYWRSFAAAFAAAIFLALSNAFGMGGMDLPMRILYWVPVLLTGTAIGRYAGVKISQRPRIGENILVLWSIITGLMSVLMSLIAWGYLFLLNGVAPFPSFLYFFGMVGLVSGAISAIMILINRPGPATHAAPRDAPSAPIRFLERMPGKLTGGAIYAVQAEDHYLRIHTSKGSDLILMRLTDAIQELEGIEGAQTHRSWWVAKEGVSEVNRANGRVSLMLKDGSEAPVSRPNVRALREAGWI